MGLVYREHLMGKLSRDGSFEIRGFPPGRWTLRVVTTDAMKEVVAEAGSTITIDLR